MGASEAGAVATRLIEAFSAGDFDAMRAAMAEDVVAVITTGDGSSVEVRGCEPLLERIAAMDLPSARYSVTLTQPPVPVDGDRAMVMVEIRAERDDRHLHNFAAHLFRVTGGQVSEWLMADAKPAESDEF